MTVLLRNLRFWRWSCGCKKWNHHFLLSLNIKEMISAIKVTMFSMAHHKLGLMSTTRASRDLVLKANIFNTFLAVSRIIMLSWIFSHQKGKSRSSSQRLRPSLYTFHPKIKHIHDKNKLKRTILVAMEKTSVVVICITECLYRLCIAEFLHMWPVSSVG